MTYLSDMIFSVIWKVAFRGRAVLCKAAHPRLNLEEEGTLKTIAWALFGLKSAKQQLALLPSSLWFSVRPSPATLDAYVVHIMGHDFLFLLGLISFKSPNVHKMSVISQTSLDLE